jgi:hypothetical protein
MMKKIITLAAAFVVLTLSAPSWATSPNVPISAMTPGGPALSGDLVHIARQTGPSTWVDYSLSVSDYLTYTGANLTAATGLVQVGTITVGAWHATPVTVAYGGTGLSSGTSGGIPYFSGSTTIASSGALSQYQLIMGGGAGASPSSIGSVGTTTTLLHGNASGAPTFSKVALTTDVSGALPTANGGNPAYLSTVSSSNTAAQNMTALAADISAAVSGGYKKIQFPAGQIKFGTSTPTVTQLTTAMDFEGVDGSCGTTFIVESGYNSAPWDITTSGLWADYAVTAVATATTGGNISTESEVTKVTATGISGITLSQGEMFSLYSNDILPYNDGDSANFAHEISPAWALSGSDLYLWRKLNRAYTVANTVKLRRYNNTGIRVNVDNICFDTDGTFNDATSAANRPDNIIRFIGLRDLHIGRGVMIKAAWEGGFEINASLDAVDEHSTFQMNNGLSGITVLGYDTRLDGPNLNARLIGNDLEQGRHSTSTWAETSSQDYTAASVGATTTLTYSADSGDDSPAVGNQVYITGIVGTLSALNGTWQTITAKTGTGSTGGTITFAYNSTGLVYTSGGSGQLYDGTNVYRYGENENQQFLNFSGNFNLGDRIDWHNNDVGSGASNFNTFAPLETTWGSINPRSAQFRGTSEYLKNGSCTRCNQFVNVFSFSQNHGLPNHPLLENIHLYNQQDRAAAQYYVTTQGDASVTDDRLLTVNNLTVDGGAYTVFSHDVNSGNMIVNNFNFGGDWGISPTASAYIATNLGGDLIFNGGTIDLTAVTTNTEVRISQTQAGRTVFNGVYLKMTCATGNFPITANTGAATITIENSTIEFPSSATDGTCRFIQVNNVAATINLFNNTFVNASKIDNSSRGLVNSSGASASATINMSRNSFDATVLNATSSSSGAFTVNNQGTRSVGTGNAILIGAANVNTSAVGNVGGGEDDLMTYALPKSAIPSAGKGVRITSWGTTANNSNPKTVKLYFGSQVILTKALTVSQAGVWRSVAEVFSTGSSTQAYDAQLLQGGTTTLTEVESGTASQTDTSAITIKATGTVTDGGGGINNNDIQQTGLLVEAIN